MIAVKILRVLSQYAVWSARENVYSVFFIHYD